MYRITSSKEREVWVTVLVPSIHSSGRVSLDLSRTSASVSRHDQVTSVLVQLVFPMDAEGFVEPRFYVSFGNGFGCRTPGAARLLVLQVGSRRRGDETARSRCDQGGTDASEVSRGSESRHPVLEPARPDQFNFRFAADRAFKEKYERLAEVLGVENPSRHMAEILEQALDKKDLKRKHERRLQRKSKRNARTEKPAKSKSRPGEISATERFTDSRYLPSEVRERVHARAGHQCEFRGPDGTRCRSRTGLEIEHTRPFALFRNHDERFLKLFCRPHNRLSAERVYGTAFIQDMIQASRRNCPEQPG